MTGFPALRRAAPQRLALICLLLTGCARYDDFTLPVARPTTAPSTFQVARLPRPVLPKGPPDSWDGVDTLNPSVLRVNGTYHNLYSGFDGTTWHTGLATSPDGVTWTRIAKVLSPDPATWEGSYIAANGSALHRKGEFWMWYQAGSPPQVGLARSADGRAWRKEAAAVLPLGPRGSWDERGVADPYVLDLDGTLYCYYLGQDRAGRQRLGVARSTDGLRWTKLRSNPVLDLGPAGAFDEVGLGEPAAWRDPAGYWMLYTGRDAREHRRIGLAHSLDGVHWQRDPRLPVLAGVGDWDSKVVCDPTVESLPDRVRVWYGGGDEARPDERLHGQIGLLTLTPMP